MRHFSPKRPVLTLFFLCLFLSLTFHFSFLFHARARPKIRICPQACHEQYAKIRTSIGLCPFSCTKERAPLRLIPDKRPCAGRDRDSDAYLSKDAPSHDRLSFSDMYDNCMQDSILLPWTEARCGTFLCRVGQVWAKSIATVLKHESDKGASVQLYCVSAH